MLRNGRQLFAYPDSTSAKQLIYMAELILGSTVIISHPTNQFKSDTMTMDPYFIPFNDRISTLL